MRELYQSDGIIAEPAGALATAALATGCPRGWTCRTGRPLSALLSGGNNDVSRYAEVGSGRWFTRPQHYFLVDFPQEPGRCAGSLTTCGPDDDITLFEYVKRTTGETGPPWSDRAGRPEDLTRCWSDAGWRHRTSSGSTGQPPVPLPALTRPLGWDSADALGERRSAAAG